MPGAESTIGTVVVDASVVVRWVVPERGSEQADELLRQPLAWIAPRLMVVEVAAALRRKVVAGELRVELAVQAIDAVITAVAGGVIELAEDEEIVPAALTLALELEHKLPDCVYLALAEREGADLVTADRRLAKLAGQRGVPSRLLRSA